MSHSVDYYFAPHSPWTYLGHARFLAIAKAAGATVRVRPVDLGKIFPLSGGLPLAKRAPQRQAYRLMELKRYGQYLKLPLTIEPKYFPVAADDAARLIIAVDKHDSTPAALGLAGAILAAVWAQERNIADAGVLAELLKESKLDAQRLEQSRAHDALQAYDTYTQQAIDVGVFGAPSYVIDGEIFWGQDRLDFVARKLGV
jgi:2-hydroxychromene-2-carboxylate isomerase